MANKKILSVKVKYPASTRHATTNNRVLQTETKWNFMRIAGAVIVLVLLIGGSIFMSEYQKNLPDSVKPLADIKTGKNVLPFVDQRRDAENLMAKVSESEASLPVPVNTKLELHLTDVKTYPKVDLVPKVSVAALSLPNGHVKRALLTNKIEQGKPMMAIHKKVKLNKNMPFAIHYFTEVLGLTGQSVYHQWFYRNRMVMQDKKQITNSPWRTSSSLWLDTHRVGEWRVRLLDEKHQILNQLSFTVD